MMAASYLSLQKKKIVDHEAKVSPWLIGFIGFVLVGSTIFQVREPTLIAGSIVYTTAPSFVLSLTPNIFTILPSSPSQILNGMFGRKLVG